MSGMFFLVYFHGNIKELEPSTNRNNICEEWTFFTISNVMGLEPRVFRSTGNVFRDNQDVLDFNPTILSWGTMDV